MIPDSVLIISANRDGMTTHHPNTAEQGVNSGLNKLEVKLEEK